MNKQKPSVSTIVRTIVLILALINQGLALIGKSPLPIQDEDISNMVSFVVTGITSVIAWWHNNSFTQSAIEADESIKKGVSKIEEK